MKYEDSSRQRLEALMNALPVGVAFSSDATCEYITGNPTLRRQLEMRGHGNISLSSHHYSKTRRLKHYINGRLITAEDMPMQRAVKENREIGPIEIEVELPSGKRWLMEAIGAPVRDNMGKVIGSVAVHIDMTERKRAEEAIRLERLVEQKKMKMEFIADATHELRTPLAIIKGNVDLALHDNLKSLPRNQRETIEKTFKAIDAEVTLMTSLLSDLTLLTIKGRDLHDKLKSNTVNINKLISNIIKRHAGFAKKKSISIHMDKLPRIIVSGDEPYLERLFSNIITNAISYGRNGGTVFVNAKKDKNKAHISIRDDGIGISKKDLPLIFGRFYRAENSRSRDYGGSGLGLAIVKWIAEAHGGSVTAESEVGKNSVFTIILPLKKT